MRYLFIFAALALLSACATLSEDQCRAGNWYDIGVRDGAKGRDSDFIFEHARACNEFGVAPRAAPWREGREEGLKQYCTARNAYRIGQRGQSLNPVCPGDTSRLEAANNRGQRWYDLERQIRDAEREIAEINNRLATLPADDPSRTSLISQRSFLRLDILTYRARQGRYRF